MDPLSYSLNDFNKLGARLSSLKGREQEFYRRLDMLSVEMRETVGLVAEIAELKFKIIKKLLKAPENERDFPIAEKYFQVNLNKIVLENVECYKALLDAREYIMEAGKPVALTKEKKQELIGSFTTFINKTIQTEKLGINAMTNLNQLKDSTKDELKTQLSVYNTLLDNKTSMTMRLAQTTCQQEKIKAAQELLRYGSSKNIWEAGERGDIQFIQQGIDDCWFWQEKDFINQQNQEGQTALSLACVNGHFDCVEFLLKNGTDPNVADNLGYRPLHWAAKKGALEIGNELVKYNATIDCQGEFKRTPLHMAAYNNHDQFVVFLLKEGANINAQTDAKAGGLSALHKAVMRENSLVVSELVKKEKLDVNLLDRHGHSALHYAITAGRSDIAALIISHSSWKCPEDRADPNHPSQLSKIMPNKNADKIKNFLKKYG